MTTPSPDASARDIAVSPTPALTLKQISREWRTLISRALNSNEHDARVNLRRVRQFVRGTPFLEEQIARTTPPAIDIQTHWEEVRNQADRLTPPDSELEELALLHAVIDMLAESSGDFWHACYRYGGADGIEESIREVMSDVVGKYGDLLRGPLESALLATTEELYQGRTGHSVHVNVATGANAQVNVANDRGQLQAVQHSGIARQDLAELARAFAEAMRSAQFPPELTEQALEVAEVVEEEAVRPKPRRLTLAAAKTKMEEFAKLVAATSTVGTKLTALIEGVTRALGG